MIKNFAFCIAHDSCYNQTHSEAYMNCTRIPRNGHETGPLLHVSLPLDPHLVVNEVTKKHRKSDVIYTPEENSSLLGDTPLLLCEATMRHLYMYATRKLPPQLAFDKPVDFSDVCSLYLASHP